MTELLIALALIGLVVTFSIPKILNSMDTVVDEAKWKDTVTVYSAVIHMGLRDDFFSTVELKDRFNALKVCNEAVANGCWVEGVQGPLGSAAGNPAVVLQNGVVITGLTNPEFGVDWGASQIDINGTDPPNTYGVDQMMLAVCFSNQNCGSGVMGGNGPSNIPGVVGPYFWSSESIALWNELYE